MGKAKRVSASNRIVQPLIHIIHDYKFEKNTLGGLTVAYREFKNKEALEYGYAICQKGDKYNRKEGVKIAKANLIDSKSKNHGILRLVETDMILSRLSNFCFIPEIYNYFNFSIIERPITNKLVVAKIMSEIKFRYYDYETFVAQTNELIESNKITTIREIAPCSLCKAFREMVDMVESYSLCKKCPYFDCLMNLSVSEDEDDIDLDDMGE